MRPGFATVDPGAAIARFLTTALGARAASVTRFATRKRTLALVVARPVAG